jgi:hypothetical protein
VSKGWSSIGVHTPEFSFEEDVDNVRKAVQERGVTYPIAIDNNRAIWSGFGNHYWPALYFIDATGRVRDHHFGEGNNEESEMHYGLPPRLPLNQWALSGEWSVKAEAARAERCRRAARMPVSCARSPPHHGTSRTPGSRSFSSINRWTAAGRRPWK